MIRIIKKITACLPLSLLLFLALSWPAMASPAGNDVTSYLDAAAQSGGLASAPANDADLTLLIAGIINVVLSLTGIIFFAQTFYHGFRWMTAAGNETIINESKSGIKQSIIGIVIVFSSFVASNFVINRIQLINESASAPAPATN